jgi:hypothetical protein
MARREEADDGDEDDERGEDDCDAAEETAASGLLSGLLWGEGYVRDHVGVCKVGEAHGLIASVNGVGWTVKWRVCCSDTPIWDLIWFTEVGALLLVLPPGLLAVMKTRVDCRGRKG